MGLQFHNPINFNDEDAMLARQLSQAIKKYRRFLHALGSSLEAPLNLCDWWIVQDGQGVELVIRCSSNNLRAHLMQSLLVLATRMNECFGPSKIRILGEHYAFEANSLQVINYYKGIDSDNSEEG